MMVIGKPVKIIRGFWIFKPSTDYGTLKITPRFSIRNMIIGILNPYEFLPKIPASWDSDSVCSSQATVDCVKYPASPRMYETIQVQEFTGLQPIHCSNYIFGVCYLLTAKSTVITSYHVTGRFLRRLLYLGCCFDVCLIIPSKVWNLQNLKTNFGIVPKDLEMSFGEWIYDRLIYI